jgi:2-polyprenyl-6-methoxyphenol hydroxylase-like FAD-dependent oxidoreductase
MTPTIIEKAPHLRTGGYIVDFWGAGFDIAEKMGLLPQITSKGYQVQEVRAVNGKGEKVAGFPARTFARVAQNRFTSLPRSELSRSIFESIEGKVETIFGDSVEKLDASDQAVRVTFASGSVREFDIVVGADGLHSGVRELAFGEEHRFEKYLGYKVAAFSVSGYRPRNELTYMMYTEVGQQVSRFSMRDDRTMFLFTFRDPDPTSGDTIDAQKQLLRNRFGSTGWECPQIMHAMDSTEDFYFDRVSQIHMPAWSSGRVVLLGDAAFCVSLLAGQGSALAMISAYILAGELHRANGDYAHAFEAYHQLFGPFVLRKQNAATRLAGSFAPKSQFSLFLRNQILNLMRIDWIADFAVGRDLADRIAIPAY